MLPPYIPAERILVILYRQIGDVLLSTPIVRALRRHYPHSHIAFLSEPSPARVLEGNPYLDDILVRPPHASCYQEWRLLRRVRRRRFDLVVDVMGNSRSTMVSWLSGARHRIGFGHPPRSWLYTMRVAGRPEVREYTVRKRLRLLEPLGIQATDLSLDFVYGPKAQEAADTFLKRHQITPDDLLICIDPTHHIPTRQWPGEYFGQLADRLRQRQGARVVLLWGPGEREQVQAIAAATRSQPVLIPASDLVFLAALLARADLFIGCDSAPLHIAVSQRTPTLSIHGSTSDLGWIPPHPRHRGVMLGLPCQPCGQARCGPALDIACLRTLSVDAVFAAVPTALETVRLLDGP